MRLLIVIVNYRTAALVIDCLRSLAPQISIPGGARVMVTDNASGDDSVSRLHAAVEQNNWSSWAQIQPLERNGGFAWGNNAAIQPALASADPPDFVLLLNPDTVVRSGALASLLHFMDSHPEAAITGPRLEFPDATPQSTACRFPSVWSEFENGMRLGIITRLLSRRRVAPLQPPDAPVPADWVSGACLMARREVFQRVGLMDDGYFMYFEEVDFCLRAQRAGYRCWYVPAARVVHLIGQSSQAVAPSAVRKRMPRYWFASRKRFFRSNYGVVRSTLADVAWALGYAIYRVRRIVQRKPDNDPRHFLWDFVRFNFLPRGPAA